MNTIAKTLSALCLLTALAHAQVLDGAGGSLALPEFDPAAKTRTILESLARLGPVSQEIQTAKDRLGPLISAYQSDPSLETRAQLEGEVAGLMLGMARSVDRALGEREKIKHAVQDIHRMSVATERSVAEALAALTQRALDERSRLDELRPDLEAAARRVQDATGPEDRSQAMLAFKSTYREFAKVAYRHRVLTGTVTSQENLRNGIGAVGRGFEAVSDHLDDVFDRIEDSAQLLAFVAGIRTDTANLLGYYQKVFGSGAGSLGEALKSLSNFENQLTLVNQLQEVLDSAGGFASIVGQLEQLSSTLVPVSEKAGSPLAPSFWDQAVESVLGGKLPDGAKK